MKMTNAMGPMLQCLLLLFLMDMNDCHKVPARKENGTVIETKSQVELFTPTHYRLGFDMEEKIDYSGAEFLGTVSISITTKTHFFDKLVLHYNETKFELKAITLMSKLQRTVRIGSISYDKLNNTMTLSVPLNATSAYTLSIWYRSRVSWTQHPELLAKSQMGEGEEQPIDRSDSVKLASYLQSSFGQYPFPCFEEEEFRSTFVLSVTLPDEDHQVYSNTAKVYDDGSEVIFAATPLMHPKLIAVAIGRFSCLDGNHFGEFKNKSNQACAEDSTDVQVFKYGLNTAPFILDALESYTNVSFAVNKLHQIIVSGYKKATIYWGLAFYPRDLMVVNVDAVPVEILRNVLLTLIDTLAHHWFGNMITHHWQIKMRLNHGITTYLSYFMKGIHGLNSFQLDSQFAVDARTKALEWDSTYENVAIAHVNDVDDENEHSFMDPVNVKIAAILKMAELILTPEVFRDDLINYLRKSAYEVENLETFYSIFEKHLPSVLPKSFVRSWIESPGYPVVSVREQTPRVIVSQQRFYNTLSLASLRNEERWYVPIWYVQSRYDLKKNSPRMWLKPGGTEVALMDALTDESAWLFLNNAQYAFYRVDYDRRMLARLLKMLAIDIGIVPDAVRAQLIDDYFTFAFAKTYKFDYVLKQFEPLLTEDMSYYTWKAFIRHMTRVMSYIDDENLFTKIAARVTVMMGKVFNSVVAEDNESDEVYTMKHRLIKEFACRLGYHQCIADALQQYEAYVRNTVTPLRKSEKYLVFCTALQSSQRSVEDINFVWSHFDLTKSVTEKKLLIKSMGCVANEELVKIIVDMAVSMYHTGLTPHYGHDLIMSVIERSPKKIRFILKYLNEHWIDIENSNLHPDFSFVLISIAKKLRTESDLQLLMGISKHFKVPSTLRNETTARLRDRKVISERIVKEIREFLEPNLDSNYVLKCVLAIISSLCAIIVVICGIGYYKGQRLSRSCLLYRMAGGNGYTEENATPPETNNPSPESTKNVQPPETLKQPKVIPKPPSRRDSPTSPGLSDKSTLRLISPDQSTSDHFFPSDTNPITPEERLSPWQDLLDNLDSYEAALDGELIPLPSTSGYIYRPKSKPEKPTEGPLSPTSSMEYMDDEDSDTCASEKPLLPVPSTSGRVFPPKTQPVEERSTPGSSVDNQDSNTSASVSLLPSLSGLSSPSNITKPMELDKPPALARTSTDNLSRNTMSCSTLESLYDDRLRGSMISGLDYLQPQVARPQAPGLAPQASTEALSSESSPSDSSPLAARQIVAGSAPLLDDTREKSPQKSDLAPKVHSSAPQLDDVRDISPGTSTASDSASKSSILSAPILDEITPADPAKLFSSAPQLETVREKSPEPSSSTEEVSPGGRRQGNNSPSGQAMILRFKDDEPDIVETEF